MSRNLINLVVFLSGLAAVCWIGAGYIGSNLLALAVTLLIAACYMAGAFELKRYGEATSSLTRAITGLTAPPASLGAWLDPLPASLRNPVRLRVEGERVSLPGPALTSYLVGLLVLLGMLGTLLGMVATLRGTGMALDSATDLPAIRASLAAPVKGLGFAFGTSIAGVATSAMLGLLSALCRRERIQAAQMLDVKIATTLRIHSQTHQREEAFRLLQRQADAMPTLVDRLEALMATIEQQNLAVHERQIASQDAFHGRTEVIYTRLAAAVERSMKDSVAESARAAGAALQPVMEATMAGLASESAALHTSVTNAVQRQLDGLSNGFESTATSVSDIWHQALAAHQRSTEALSDHLRTSLDRFTEVFEERSANLLDGVSTRLETTTASMSDAWNDALSRQERTGGKLAQHNEHALNAAAATFQQHSVSLLDKVAQSHADLQTELASRDEQRLAAWTGQLASMAATLSHEWEQAGTRTASRQQEICDTLAETARDISAQTQAHASETIGEIARLVQAASEAPRAAAEMIAELRAKLSDSMVRDTAMLEERSRLLATLETLLSAVNHASTEQRSAVDALVSTSADLLDRVGTRFTEKVETETGKLAGIAAQVTGSAVEVASLGEAFGVAVQRFGDSNETLVTHLQRIEAALDKSLARSDEQLAYYVAQAREVVDLSVMSQKQIIEDLQQIAGKRAAGAEAA
ncbi:DUF802 domain-containing protein [Caballeronia sp. DA-9]|uniref:DUF802 domain-containing protein n=1 Tax=Caballeronia sp. DA-9 TaxID=3436237 RepID=UPI003F66CBC8